MSGNLISSNFMFLLCTLLQLSLLIHSKPVVPALYAFGDSLFENGNNNDLPTLAKANYPPYGQDFPGKTPGRFTNGRTLPDIIAELLELPYPPPYMKMNESMTLSGFNYASSSCGILHETGRRIGKCFSLGEQIDLFQQTIESKMRSHFESSKELSKYLAKSIIIITIGSNDYLQNYFEPTLFSRVKDYDPQTFAQLLTDALSNHFERLYKLGARKIIMLEVAPLGCIPYLTRKYKLNGKCHEESNQMVSYFNSKLDAMLKYLTSTLEGSIFVLARVNSLVRDFIDNPSKYGYTDTSNPCCKTWGNGSLSCIPWQVPCPNPNQHFFWDGFHNTEAGNSIAASLCFNDPQLCTPFTLKQLIQM